MDSRDPAKQHGFRDVIAATLLVLLTATACIGRHRPTADISQPVRTVPASVDLRTLLAQSWATNGTDGFFIEAPDIASAMSLYSTRWWLDILTATQGHDSSGEGLDVSAVRAWVSPFAYEQNAPGGDAVTLPALERIDDAVDILDSVGIRPDPAAVIRNLQFLRRGNQFAAQSAGKGDWADTVLALSLYRKVGAVPPAAVAEEVSRQVPRAINDRRSADLLPLIVPVLSSLSGSIPAERTGQLVGALNWIQSQLPMLPVLARMSIATSLRPLIASWGQPEWKAAEICPGLDISAAGVSAVKAARPDPQLTFEGLSLGCIHQQQIPAWSSSGWPNAQTVGASLPASVDGMRVAVAVGTASRYTSALRQQLQQVWVPALGAQPSSPAAVAADWMALLLGLPPVVARSSGEIASALATDTPDTLSELLLGLITHPNGIAQPTGQPSAAVSTAAGRSTNGSEPGPLTEAVVDELKARLAHTVDDHTAALALLNALQTGPYLYALTPTGSPSLTATIIAAWIRRIPLPSSALRAAGICRSEYACTNGVPPTAAPQLQTAAATMALANTADNLFPFSF